MPLDIYTMYAYVGVICALIILIIRNRVFATVHDEVVDKPFAKVLIFYTLFCLIDAVWGFVCAQRIRPLVVLFSYAFHLMAALSSLMGAYYELSYMKIQGKAQKVLIIWRNILFLLQLGFLIANIFVPIAFTVDEMGGYHSTRFRPYSFYMQFAQYLPMLIWALLNLFKSADTTKRYTYRTGLFYILIPIAFGVLQMLYPDGPFYSIGFMFVTTFIYAFNVAEQRNGYIAAYYTAQEREKSRAQIEDALARAESASNAKTMFLANMSHDIRTPINGIMGMVSIAKRHEMSPDIANCIDKIDSASHHLLMLINDVLDMSRIESGRLEVPHAPFNIEAMADNCNSIILGQIEGKNLHYTCTQNSIQHPYVVGDILHVRQILVNILGNSVKFTPADGHITFEIEEFDADENKTWFRFTCSDTGIGMKPEFLEHIFEPFSQENNSSRGNYQGTGLGMSIAKQLVELLGGHISVTSKINCGTTFVVEIPFEIDKSEHIVESKEEVASVRGLKVLLVEDNELNMEIATTILEDEDVIVTPAENGRIAVKTFESNPEGTFDVILMDIMMPELNGYEATKAIRALKRPDASTIPILAMTANAFDEDRIKALEAGMNGHIAKPINFRNLFTELGKFAKK